MAFFVFLRRVIDDFSDVSEERIAFICTVTNLGQLGVEVVWHQGQCHFGHPGEQLVSSPAC